VRAEPGAGHTASIRTERLPIVTHSRTLIDSPGISHDRPAADPHRGGDLVPLQPVGSKLLGSRWLALGGPLVFLPDGGGIIDKNVPLITNASLRINHGDRRVAANHPVEPY